VQYGTCEAARESRVSGGGFGGGGYGWRTAIADRMAYGMDHAATAPMIYQFYQAQADALAPIRALAQAGRLPKDAGQMRRPGRPPRDAAAD